ncbi:MAG: hypothetical protein JRI55_06060, partial [Deltaproteobacteria bacterium]|nr:hypothetical protein [Deltaproteobacteria bacterium]
MWNELNEQTRGQAKGPPVRDIMDELDIGPDSVVVELGAGDGSLTIELARQLESAGGRGV